MADASRQFVLRLSAQGVDNFVGDLRQAAQESEAARRALEGFTRAAPQLATGTERATAALAASTAQMRAHAAQASAFSAAQDTAAGGARNFGHAIGNLGAQAQDFAVQVASGTAALTAFGQQAPQALSVFGPGGIIAGAAVAVGVVAASFLGLGGDAKKAADQIEAEFKGVTEGQEALAKAVQAVNALYLTQAERARTAAAASREATAATLQAQQGSLVQRNEGNALEQSQVRAEIERLERLERASQELRERQRRAGAMVPVQGEADFGPRLYELRSRLSGLQADTERTSQRIGEAEQALQRLRAAPTDERRAQTDALEEAERRRQEAERIAAAPRADRARVTAQLEAENKARELNLQGQERERFIRDNVAAAIARQAASTNTQTAALTKAANTAEAHAAGMLRSAQAADEGRGAFLRAAAAAEAHKQAANGAAGSEARLAAEILNRNAAQAASRGAEAILNLREQAAALERMTEAVAQGPAAERAAQIEERVRNATREMLAFAEATSDPAVAEALRSVAEQTGEATREVERGNDALQITRTLRTQREDLEILLQERDLIGTTVEHRERETAALRVRRDLLARGATTDQIAEAEAVARAQADIRTGSRQIEASWNDLGQIGVQVFDRIGQAITNAVVSGQLRFKDLGRVALATLGEIAQGLLRLAVVNPALNAFTGSNRGTLGGLFGGTGSAGAGGGGGLLSDAGTLLSAAGTARSVGGMFGVGGGAGAAEGPGFFGRLGGYATQAWDVAQGVGSSLAGGNAASGLSGVDSFLNTPLFSTQTLSAGEQAFRGAAGLNANPSFTVGNAVGGAASVLGGAYGIYSGLQRGGIGGTVQAIGGGIGAAAGAASLAGLGSAAGALSAIPVYGWIAAAVLSIIGALLPGQKPSNREGNATVNLNTGDIVLGGQEGGKFSAANREMARQQAESIRGLVDQLEQRLGGRAVGDFTVGVGDRDGIYFRYADQMRRYPRDERGAETLSRELLGEIIARMEGFSEAVERARHGLRFDQPMEAVLQRVEAIASVTNQGRPTASQNIASRSLDFAANFDAAIAELQWVRDVYEPLTRTSEQANEFQAQLDALAQQWEPAIERATRLGLETGRLTAEWRRLEDEMRASRDREIATLRRDLRTRIAAGVGEQDTLDQAARETFDARAAEETETVRRRLQALGVETEQLTDLMTRLSEAHAGERAAIERSIAARIREQDVALQAATKERMDANAAREQSIARTLEDNSASIALRRARLAGDPQGAELMEFDARSAAERQALQRALHDLAAAPAATYAHLVELERVQAEERLAIQREYAQRAAAEELARQRTLADARTSISARLARAGGDLLGADIIEFNARAAAERRALEEAGADLGLLTDMERAQAEERLAIQRRYAEEAVAQERSALEQRTAAARGLLEELATGQLGGLAPEARYFASIQSLNAARRSLDGSPESVQDYVEQARTALQVAREFHGTSERFAALQAEIAGTLRDVVPGADRANLAALIQANTSGSEQIRDTLVLTNGATNELLRTLVDEVRSLREENRRLAAQQGAFLHRVAAAA